MKMYGFVVDIYEVLDDKPILTIRHVSFGITKKRAIQIHKSHLKTDEFYAAAFFDHSWMGTKLQTRCFWILDNF